MKKVRLEFVILLCTVLALASCKSKSSAPEQTQDVAAQTEQSIVQQENNLQDINEPQDFSVPFSSVDANVDGIQLGNINKTTLISAFGTDKIYSINKYILEATGAEIEEYEYEFGKFTFTDGIFTGVSIYSKLSGPRGLQVGDRIDDVIHTFCSAPEYSEQEYTIYYRANEGDSGKSVVIPPSCVLYNKNELKELELTCYDNPDMLEVSSLEYLRENYMFEVLYTCSFCFDENGIVTSINLFYGALAE